MPIRQKQTAQEGKSTDYCCFKTHLSWNKPSNTLIRNSNKDWSFQFKLEGKKRKEIFSDLLNGRILYMTNLLYNTNSIG